MRRNGESNPVTYVFIALLVAAAFYAFHAGPVYIDNLEVKEAANEAFNVYWLNGEESARNKLVIRLNNRGLGTHLAVDENGVESWPTGLGVDPERVTFVETEDGQLTVTVNYDRVVEFKPLSKRRTFNVTATKVGKKLK